MLDFLYSVNICEGYEFSVPASHSRMNAGQVSQLLQTAFSDAPESRMAVDTINQMSLDPAYQTSLVEIIRSPEFDDRLSLIASIQLKNVIISGAPISLAFEELAGLIVSSPVPVKRQLQAVLSVFIRNSLEQIQGILQMCFEYAQNDVQHALVAVMTLRSLAKIEDRQFHQSLGCVCESHVFLNLANLVAENPRETFFIHLCLLTFARFVKITGCDAVQVWVDLILRILREETSDEFVKLDKDATKLAIALIPRLPADVNGNLLVTIATHVINGSDYGMTLCAFQYLNMVMTNDEVWPFIEDKQLDLTGGLFFRVFVLSQEELFDAERDIDHFIETTEITAYDFKTPRNGAASAFTATAKKHPTMTQLAIQLVLCELASFRESGDLGRAYGALMFASVVLSTLQGSLCEQSTKSIAEAAYGVVQASQSPILMAGFFSFLSYVKVDCLADVSLLYLCFEQILSSPMPLVQYFAMNAARNLLLKFKGMKNEIKAKLGDSLPRLLTTLLYMGKGITTYQSMISVQEFSDFFIEDMGPLSIDYVKELFSLFSQSVVDDSNRNVGMFVTRCQLSIDNVCRMIHKCTRDAGPFFMELLLNTENVALECNPTYLEDVLKLMECVVDVCDEPAPPLLNIPKLLLSVCEKMGLASHANMVSIFFAMAKKSKEMMVTPEILSPICEFAKLCVAASDSDTLIPESLVSLLQLLFVVLHEFDQIKELVTPFLQLIATKKQIVKTQNVIAAFVTTDPAATLVSEEIVAIWLNRSDPAPFLASAMTVLSVWDSLSDNVKTCKPHLEQAVSVNKAKLEEEYRLRKEESFVSIGGKVGDEFETFDIEQILHFYSS